MLNTTGSTTLCGIENEARGNEQTLCPNCVQVRDALNVCRLGPESIRELYYQETTIRTQIYSVKRVEAFYGDLDKHYAKTGWQA